MIQKHPDKQRYYKRGIISRWFKCAYWKMKEEERQGPFSDAVLSQTIDNKPMFGPVEYWIPKDVLIVPPDPKRNPLTVLDFKKLNHQEPICTIVPVITREEVVTWLHELSKSVHENKSILPESIQIPEQRGKTCS